MLNSRFHFPRRLQWVLLVNTPNSLKLVGRHRYRCVKMLSTQFDRRCREFSWWVPARIKYGGTSRVLLPAWITGRCMFLSIVSTPFTSSQKWYAFHCRPGAGVFRLLTMQYAGWIWTTYNSESWCREAVGPGGTMAWGWCWRPRRRQGGRWSDQADMYKSGKKRER